MKIVDIKPDDQDVFIRICKDNHPVSVYQVQVSKRKFSAQLNAVKGFAKELILKHKRA